MKVLIFPLGAMAAILIFSLWTGSYVQRQTTNWEQLLEQAADAAADEDWSRADRCLSQAQESWEQCKTFFHTIIEHSELNEVEVLFAAAADAYRQRDSQEILSQLALLSVQLRVLAETQAVSIKNFL